MKTLKKTLFYPLGLYKWLSGRTGKVSKKRKPAMAILMVALMLCSLLPATVTAAGWDNIPEGGVGFYWGSSGFINVTMPTVEGNYTYGNASTWEAEELVADASELPSSGWNWAVQKEADGCRVILNGIYIGITNGESEGGLMCKSNLTLELRGSNTIFSWYSPEGTAVLKGTGKLDIVGTGSLYLESNRNGISIDGPLHVITGNLKVSAEERAIIANSVELDPGIHALISDNADGQNAQIYNYSGLGDAKWFQGAYIASGSSYTVKFNPKDNNINSTGAGTMANVENVVGAYTLPENGFTPEAGMRFKAWETSVGERMPGELILVTENTTISAVWEDAPDTFTVSYYRGNGSGSMDSAKGVVGPFTLPANALTPPPGMLFKAWSVDDTEYAPGDIIQVTKDTYVYAVWEDDPTTIAVFFDPNGGRGTLWSKSENSTNPFQCTLPANEWPNQFYEPDNTYFAGWLVGDILMQPGDTITITEDTVVKAAWEIDEYHVTVGGVNVDYQNAHNITGSSINGTVSYDYATQTLTLNNATIYSVYSGGTVTTAISTGYFDFEGKLTIRLIGDNTIYGDLVSGPATSSHRYAVMAKDLVFEGDGSLTVTASQADGAYFYDAIESDNDIEVKSDCTIIAIANSSSGSALSFGSNGKLIAESSTVLASASATGNPLVAFSELGAANKYVKIQPAYNVNVSFDANGGTGTMADVNPVCSKEYTLPECGFTAPTGKQFKAWSVNGSEKEPGDKVAFMENSVVTAIWEEVTHTCSIEPVEKVWPDCENGGKEAYYKCNDCGKFFEDANGTTEIADIAAWGNLPKNGHTEGTEWKSDDDNHWHICTVAGCGAVIDNSKAAHTSTGANAATCQSKAVCDDCGATYGDFAGHDWNSASWEKDVTGHWHKCNTVGCTEKNAFAQHTPDHQGGATEEYAVKCSVCYYEMEAQLNHTHIFNKEVAEEQYMASGATCTEPAKYYKSCACGEKGTETFESGPANDHIEGTEWKSDEDNHWHICTVAGCGAVIENSKATHTPDRVAATETDPVKCSVCGYEIVPALGHTHDYGTEWQSDKDNHWNECDCGDEANTAAHRDENADGKCDVCAYNVGLPTPPADSKSPQTGDNSNIKLWILLFVSAVGISLATIKQKKSKEMK